MRRHFKRRWCVGNRFARGDDHEANSSLRSRLRGAGSSGILCGAISNGAAASASGSPEATIMKRILPFAAGCAALAAVVFYAAPFQNTPPRPLAALAPGGALLYLESPDFARELRDWNQSPEKRTWLAGANYAEFSRSMLFLRLTEEWKAFGGAAGFAADLPMLESIAGKRSAVGVYDIGP